MKRFASATRLALHGGAADRVPEARRDYEDVMGGIADAGVALLRSGASAVETVEFVVARLEEHPLFNAGVGAALNRNGLPELDAAIMDGRTRACGSVAAVSRVQSPVRLARAVMERTPHVMFTGAGAEELASRLRLEIVTPEYFITDASARRQQEDAFDDASYGTVGAVARDVDGHLAAASSTGGLVNKPPGRVSDTPVIGAGTFADNDSVAVVASGTGESFIRACFGYHVHARLQLSSVSLLEACVEGLARVREFGGRGGCIAISRQGELALPFNSRAMPRAWAAGDGVVHVALGSDFDQRRKPGD